MTDIVSPVAPPPVAYHHLARWSAPGRWRIVVGSVVILFGTIFTAGALIVVAVIAAEILGVRHDADDFPILPPLAETALSLVGIAVALPITLVVVRVLQNRPAGTLSSVLGRVRWGWLGWCLLLASGAITLTFGVSFALEAFFPTTASDETATGAWVGLGPFLGTLLLLVAIVPLQAAAEEYVFRGWLLQSVGSLTTRLWPAIAVQAVLFAAVHGWGTLWGFVDLVIWASLMALLAVRTGGLEASVALHTVNNLMAMAWAVAFDALDLDVTAADMSLLFLAIDIPVVTLYVLAVIWLARRKKLPTHAEMM